MQSFFFLLTLSEIFHALLKEISRPSPKDILVEVCLNPSISKAGPWLRLASPPHHTPPSMNFPSSPPPHAEITMTNHHRHPTRHHPPLNHLQTMEIHTHPLLHHHLLHRHHRQGLLLDQYHPQIPS
ncbi:hypothetical protein Leryth_018764 [Lithospermum erythrorhizon]|nr:hypothetical protein Leryth_018764 [Lithospermum erythrorhizon]